MLFSKTRYLLSLKFQFSQISSNAFLYFFTSLNFFQLKQIPVIVRHILTLPQYAHVPHNTFYFEPLRKTALLYLQCGHNQAR